MVSVLVTVLATVN